MAKAKVTELEAVVTNLMQRLEQYRQRVAELEARTAALAERSSRAVACRPQGAHLHRLFDVAQPVLANQESFQLRRA